MQNYSKSNSPVIRTPKPILSYNFDTKDRLSVIAALVIGFLFWQWQVLFDQSLTLGVFIFLVLTIGTTFFYIREKGIKHTKFSAAILLLAVLSSLYFLIFDYTPIHFFVFIFIIFLYIMWVVTVTGTNITRGLNGFILCDYLNQIFIVPFLNFSAMFRSILTRDRESKKMFLYVIIGILVSVPLILIVIPLLAEADSGFQILVDKIDFLIYDDLLLFWYIRSFLLGIPVACYFYGFIYGNKHRRKTDKISYEGMNERFIRMHAIPGVTVFVPLAILNFIYLVFFIAMGSYLFSAFAGDLPADLTYAEYARRGFFELCAVATINLAVIIFSYTGVKRKECEYPLNLKILTGVLSSFTVLLVLTAMSKMLMYISSYGLTRLRIYTFWFMVVILFVFILLIIWHFKQYHIGKLIVTGFVILFLMLAMSNSDGLIAKYNINAYEKGTLETLDIELFYELSDAAYPYVANYGNRVEDPEMKTQMNEIVKYYRYDYLDMNDIDNSYSFWCSHILKFNLQSFFASRYSNN